jgi:2,4-dichlorophenol 6-monooxygenase
MKARADELSPGRIRFNHELIALEQDDDGVRATIRDNGAGDEYEIRCEYLIGADGGRRVPELIGVGYEGLGVIAQEATLHVTADFSQWATDPDVLIRWIYSPQGGVLAVMVPMGPERWGRNGSSTSTTPPTWRSPTRRSRPTRAAPSESATCR